ncbi:hypothetical protein LINPERHAP2_LOCUS19744, partial [Linum perenne]
METTMLYGNFLFALSLKGNGCCSTSMELKSCQLLLLSMRTTSAASRLRFSCDGHRPVAMVSLSAQVGGSSAASWASIVAGEKSDLRFVEASKSSVVDGVLKLPKEVLEVGVKKLKAAVVAQF